MKNLCLRKYLFFVLIIFSFFQIGHAQQETISGRSPSAVHADINSLIVNLAEFKAFRKKSHELDLMVERICKKTRYFKDESGVDAEFSCDGKKFGINSVEYYAIEVPNSPNYLMYFRMHFSYADFSRIKQVVASKLGAATKKNHNYWVWRNKTDKFLNDRGNPVISVSSDKLNNTATFSLVLEQGDG